jgi:hypothetical protein
MIKKVMLARPVPGLAAFLQAHFQASLQMALQKLRSIRFANDQRPGSAPEEGLWWNKNARFHRARDG